MGVDGGLYSAWPRSVGKEKQIWVTREVKTKARGNNRRRPNLLPRKNGNRKKKRRKSKPRTAKGIGDVIPENWSESPRVF